MQSTPFSLSIPSHGCIVVHAGMLPGVELEKQDLFGLIEVLQATSHFPQKSFADLTWKNSKIGATYNRLFISKGIKSVWSSLSSGCIRRILRMHSIACAFVADQNAAADRLRLKLLLRFNTTIDVTGLR